jgi:glycosyltransferase involved in cell wall biosynthesis
MVISGHPTGNPNSHHAALAWHERGRLLKFCTPWFPSQQELNLIGRVPGLREQARRLSRRRFEALSDVPMRQDKLGEMARILRGRAGWSGPEVTQEANQWLMQVMSDECRDARVTAVHSFEDCSVGQFREAQHLGKACIYDMPTCHWKFWERQHQLLCARYADWIRSQDAVFALNASREQKDEELGLADVVLAPSTFVKRTLEEAGGKNIRVCRYGVDREFWSPAAGGGEETKRTKDQKMKGQPDGGDSLLVTGDSQPAARPLRFIYAGQCSLRKGIPFLLEVWEKAGLRDAELTLVGSWKLAGLKLQQLPRGVSHVGPVSAERLRELYRQSDVFLFPSFGDGFGLVMLEALAAGLRVMASDTSGGPDLAAQPGVLVLPSGNEDAWIEGLRAYKFGPDSKVHLGEEWKWERYRSDVFAATEQLTA